MREPPGIRVGMARAFVGHYPSARLIREFLRQAGFDLVLSPATTPDILAAGTTLASAEYCLPLRVMVGHIHHLCRHGDLDYLVCPNIYRENPISSTCAKYRDTGGVAVRSLAGSLGYTLRRTPRAGRLRLEQLLGAETAAAATRTAAIMPTVLDPNIWSGDHAAMRHLCRRLYLDLLGQPRSRRLLASLGIRTAPVRRADRAFERAVERQRERARHSWDQFRRAPGIRLVLVGRDYLVEDPLLTADLKPFFTRAGASVLTARDVPFELLEPGYRATRGYYDAHKLLNSLIDLTIDVTDGYVIASSFGCHPDAFMMETFLDAIRQRGVPAWLLKYDEQTGSAGYRTRYETIYGFLKERADRRRAVPAAAPPAPEPVSTAGMRPAIVWPHFTPVLDLALGEVLHQVGLSGYAVPPLALSQQTVSRPDVRFAEACCPYAITTGSFLDTLEGFLQDLEARAQARGRAPEPHHIIMGQASGEGPCTFGWYALAQREEIPRLLRERLQRGGHVLEMATVGLDGGMDLLGKLADLGDARRLGPIVRFAEHSARGGGWLQRVPAALAMVRGLWPALRAGWLKLRAFERLRARWLILRAHELERGSFFAAYSQGQRLIGEAHGPGAIRRAGRRAMALLEAVPRDRLRAPRVAVVGEIYICLSSFANRGTVENLLGRERVEVVEAITLGEFLSGSLAEMLRRTLGGLPPVAWLQRFLAGRDIAFLPQKVRDRGGRPFAYREFGGEGVRCVGLARTHIERGVDGIIHLYPFKCMPEGIAKDALRELCGVYGVRYLPLSFHRETELERLRTEISTFAALLHTELDTRGPVGGRELGRRRQLGQALVAAHDASRRGRHLD